VSTVGVGIDLVDVDRFAAVLARRPGVATRLFTHAELADARGRATSLAARFAAKEATWKALGLGLGAAGFHDVEVRTAASGAPQLRVEGRLATVARRADVARWHLSLSHTDGCAAAVVVAST
jgi:holo-[acyl-carrier protein] synthase